MRYTEACNRAAALRRTPPPGGSPGGLSPPGESRRFLFPLIPHRVADGGEGPVLIEPGFGQHLAAGLEVQAHLHRIVAVDGEVEQRASNGPARRREPLRRKCR